MTTPIKDDVGARLDPARLGEFAGITLDPWQADVVRSADRQLILNCHRQSGKSTTVALKALHVALYKRSLVLLLSPSLRQSRELFRKVTDVYRALKPTARAEIDNSLELKLTGAGRIVSLPGTEATVRGFSAPKLVIMDEASKIPSALYTAVRPMLAVSRGSLALLSTPYGRRGFFHQEWTEGGPNWKRILQTADRCPRITPDWLEEEKLHMEEWEFRQEYMCQFADTAGQFFREEDILAAFREGNAATESGDPFGTCEGLIQSVPPARSTPGSTARSTPFSTGPYDDPDDDTDDDTDDGLGDDDDDDQSDADPAGDTDADLDDPFSDPEYTRGPAVNLWGDL